MTRRRRPLDRAGAPIQSLAKTTTYDESSEQVKRWLRDVKVDHDERRAQRAIGAWLRGAA